MSNYSGRVYFPYGGTKYNPPPRRSIRAVISRDKRFHLTNEDFNKDKEKEEKPKPVDPFVKALHEEALREQEEIIRKMKKEHPEDPHDFMPLPANVRQMEISNEEREASLKNDKKFYGKGKFYGDEQAQKTKEYSEHKEGRGLLGYDCPDDPGYNPEIEYAWDCVLKPHIKGVTQKHGRPYNIFPFKWEMVGTDYTVVVLGKRRSGKTCFIKALCAMRLRPFFPRVVVFTKTKYSAEYAKFVPESQIIGDLDEDKLRALFEIQKTFKEKSLAGSFKGNMNLLIIIDDCLSAGLKYQKLIDQVFFEGRHMGIFFIVTSQDIKGINPACHSNADLGVFFNVRSERDKEAMRTKFCDFFKNNEEMEEVTDQVLHQKWHTMIFNQSEPSTPSEFTMFCGRAPEPPPFVMGAKALWKFNKRQLDAIVKQHPEELGYLLETDEWGVIGEEEFNRVRGV